jgi:hypothetical protein
MGNPNIKFLNHQNRTSKQKIKEVMHQMNDTDLYSLGTKTKKIGRQ